MTTSQTQNADLTQAPGRIRTFHRWISMLFLVTVVANFLAMAIGNPPPWVTYSPLLPLLFLLGTGIILLVKHYLPHRERSGHCLSEHGK